MKQLERSTAAFGKVVGAAAAVVSKADEPRRRAARKPTRCLGYLVLPETRKELECLVVDMSASGAKLKLVAVATKPFAPPFEFPKSFRLILPAEKIEVECNTCWSKGPTCGVTFATPFRATRT